MNCEKCFYNNLKVKCNIKDRAEKEKIVCSYYMEVKK